MKYSFVSRLKQQYNEMNRWNFYKKYYVVFVNIDAFFQVYNMHDENNIRHNELQGLLIFIVCVIF